MDLSFNLWERDAGTALVGGFAVLLVGIAARQAASPTALAQARLERRQRPGDRLRPRGGSFSAAVAQALVLARVVQAPADQSLTRLQSG